MNNEPKMYVAHVAKQIHEHGDNRILAITDTECEYFEAIDIFENRFVGMETVQIIESPRVNDIMEYVNKRYKIVHIETISYPMQ
jgi:hypothetical protein